MTVRGRPRYAAGYVREISKQILLGLGFPSFSGFDSFDSSPEDMFLSTCSSSPGTRTNAQILLTYLRIDLQPANILFSVDGDLSSDSLVDPEFSPVHWLPGVKVDNSAPRYLMSSQRPGRMLDNALSLQSLSSGLVVLVVLLRNVYRSDEVDKQ
jgi:serine/threonine-protein kinase SRPK3